MRYFFCVILCANEETMAQEIKSYDIADLDCTKMLIHPKNSQLVNFMNKNIPELKNLKIEEVKGFSRAMIYRYVILMFDPNSPIQKMNALDQFEKKFEACAFAGFELSKGRDGYYRFSDRVLKFVMGEDEAVNDAIIFFLAWQNNSKWDYLVYLKESMLAFTRDALGNKNRDAKTSTEYRKIYDLYNQTINDMSNAKEEREEFVSRFYYQIERSRLAIRPEDYSKALAEGDDLQGDSPYGIGYVVDRIKFVGDTLPDEE